MKIFRFKYFVYLVWAGFVVWFLTDQYGGTAQSQPLDVSAFGDSLQHSQEASWFNIYLADQKIGWNMSVTNALENGIGFYDRSVLDLPVAGSNQEVVYEQTVITDSSLNLKSFTLEVQASVMSTKITGRKSRDGINLTIESGGNTQEQFIPVPGDVSLPITLWKKYPIDQFQPGTSYSLPVFDPSTMSMNNATLKAKGWEQVQVGDGKQEALHIVTTFGDISSDTWINHQGEVVKEQSLMDLTMIRTSADEAQQLSTSPGGTDLYKYFAIRVKHGLKNARAQQRLKITLSGVDFSPDLLSNHRQLVSPVKNGYLMLIDPDGDFKENPPTDENLQSTPLVQCTDSRIDSVTRTIVSASMPAAKKVHALMHWVFTYVKKQPSVGIPSAVEVLKQGIGDCNEHTVLFTALARAAGIPAKMRAGVVFVNDGFYYHAWPSVYIHDHWQDVDPTFGQDIADASHIALSEGELFDMMTIAQTLGKLKITIVSTGNE